MILAAWKDLMRAIRRARYSQEWPETEVTVEIPAMTSKAMRMWDPTGTKPWDVKEFLAWATETMRQEGVK